MTSKNVIKFLKDNLKDEEGTVGIKLSTDGDSGIYASIYSRFIYNYDTCEFKGDPLVYIRAEDVRGYRITIGPEFLPNKDAGYSVSDIQLHYGIPTKLIPLMEEIYDIDEGLIGLEDSLYEEYLSKLHPKDYELINSGCDWTVEAKVYSLLKKSTTEIQNLFINYAPRLYTEIHQWEEEEGAKCIHHVSKEDVINMVEQML